MNKFIEKIKNISEKYEKIAMFIDMDGTIIEYTIYPANETDVKLAEKYCEIEPIEIVVDKLKEINELSNIDLYILTLSKNEKITEEKKKWLKRYVSFITEENWIILTKWKKYTPENRNIIKGKTIEEKLNKYNHAILLDDEQTASSENKVTSMDEEEEDMLNFVMRSKSGKQGYVGCVNGSIFGIGDIGTVVALQEAGCKHLVLDDGDFDRLISSQKIDDDKRNEVLKVALENVANTIKNK